MPTKIDIYADFICPWCYIGLARLARLEQEYAVRRCWKPYLLRPDIAPGGVPLSSILPPERLESAEAAVREAAQAAGLPLNRPAVVPNTRQAHEVAWLAEQRGAGDAFHRAVFHAPFGQAWDIGNPEVLAEIGRSVGMDGEDIMDALTTARYRQDVEHAAAQAVKLGVRSVPTFIFASGNGFSGARSYEYFLGALGDARQVKDLTLKQGGPKP